MTEEKPIYLEYGGAQAVDGSLGMAVKRSVSMRLSLLHTTSANTFFVLCCVHLAAAM